MAWSKTFAGLHFAKPDGRGTEKRRTSDQGGRGFICFTMQGPGGGLHTAGSSPLSRGKADHMNGGKN